MQDKNHLPLAASLPNLGRLDRVPDASLFRMADECARWLRNTSECRASIVTPAAKTLWSALVQGEIDQVTRIHDRLRTELSNRMPMDTRAARRLTACETSL